MNVVDLNTFFEEIGYDFKKDYDQIKTICYYTKTRPGQEYDIDDFSPGRGSGQTFLIKALLDHAGATSFFEMGTGRGTACYAAALCDKIKQIITVDIIPHDYKKNEAIGGKPEYVSNKDLYDMIPYEEKNKISFKNRNELSSIFKNYSDSFDVCFIDGNHDNPHIILEDYMICRKLMKDKGIIIWDDYDPNRFKVKDVVDHIVNSSSNIECFLLETRGHLFAKNDIEKAAGTVIMEIQ